MTDLPMVQNPWTTFSRLQNQINQLLSASDANVDDSSGVTAQWVPPADIHEFENRFVLYVDMPGVDPKQVDLTLETGVLTISGNRAGPEREVVEGDARPVRLRQERGFGRFHRRFILPDTVEADAVKARGRDGVLEIEIPKKQKAMPRRIKVAA